MKIKINWGWGVVIALASFMIFISTLVFQMFFDKKYDHQLVSENYYKDDMLYQFEVDKLDNSKKLIENVSIKPAGKNLQIIFPHNLDFAKIEGMIYFQYLTDEKFDFEQAIELENNILIINQLKLKKGKWNVKIDWKYQDVPYLLKERIVY